MERTAARHTVNGLLATAHAPGKAALECLLWLGVVALLVLVAVVTLGLKMAPHGDDMSASALLRAGPDSATVRTMLGVQNAFSAWRK